MEPQRRHDRLLLLATHESRALESFADAVRVGLSKSPKSIPYRFLYDAVGSRLFTRITELPEYYPTTAERQILRARSHEIAARFTRDTILVELGSGSSDKTRLVLGAFLRAHGPLRYAPVDISRVELERTTEALLEEYPELEIVALAGEYRAALHLLSERPELREPKLVLWLGSSIGNFERHEAASFLGDLRAELGSEDRLLVGVDLRKDRRTLERAYDDSAGVTARFNRNLLARINRELQGHFDLESFRHEAVWEERGGRVAMHLVSLRAQRVAIDALGVEYAFAEGERIHTENSYKYSPEEITALADRAGLRVEERWLDAERRFSLNLMAPRTP